MDVVLFAEIRFLLPKEKLCLKIKNLNYKCVLVLKNSAVSHYEDTIEITIAEVPFFCMNTEDEDEKVSIKDNGLLSITILKLT